MGSSLPLAAMSLPPEIRFFVLHRAVHRDSMIAIARDDEALHEAGDEVPRRSGCCSRPMEGFLPIDAQIPARWPLMSFHNRVTLWRGILVNVQCTDDGAVPMSLRDRQGRAIRSKARQGADDQNPKPICERRAAWEARGHGHGQFMDYPDGLRWGAISAAASGTDRSECDID